MKSLVALYARGRHAVINSRDENIRACEAAGSMEDCLPSSSTRNRSSSSQGSVFQSRDLVFSSDCSDPPAASLLLRRSIRFKDTPTSRPSLLDVVFSCLMRCTVRLRVKILPRNAMDHLNCTLRLL